MNIRVVDKPAFTQALPAILLFAFEKEQVSAPASVAAHLSRLTSKEFDGSEGQLYELHPTSETEVRSPRILLAGLGKRAQFTQEKLRRAAGKAVKKLRDAGIDEAAIQLTPDTQEALASVVESAILATYTFNEFKSDAPLVAFKALTICVGTEVDLKAARRRAQAAQVVAEASNYSRLIGNLPPNVVYPASLAQRARELAAELKLTCRVFNKTALEKGGFGGLLAVGAGSIREPQLIVLEYKGAFPKQKPIALVGKALTFDSGGISIKPADRMEEMKFDKCGGCAVLGIMRAAAQLKLPINLLGVIAAAENMPGASSYRPSDIVTSYKGKEKRGVTIEVINTDAEGRVVLGDALAYAREQEPQVIIDFATLTGACVVALGQHAAGLFGNNDALIEKLRQAGERTGERCWPLPLWQEYRDKIKSDVADHKNTGGREAGAITAAAFLSKYVGDTPWAHLDIAGTAWITEERPYLIKGATGFGVRLLIDALENWKAL